MRQSWIAAAVLLMLLLTLLVVGARQDAGVVDEHPHILSGVLYWQSGTFAGGFDNPPLGQLWLTAPLRALGVDYRFPDDRQLLWARFPTVVLTGLLAVLMALWAQSLGGPLAAAVVVGLFCLEPTLLAHGHLATLDVPLTCAWWATLWWARRWLLGNSRSAWGVCVALAIAVLIKFTALLLLPIVFLVGVLHQRSWRGVWQALRLCAVAVLVTWGLAWLTYGSGAQQWGWPQGFVDAIVGKWQHRNEGHFSYLAGRRSMQGFPEYHLVALAVKTPIPLLALSAAGLLACWRAWPRLDRLLLLLPSLVLLVGISASGVDIGVRHVLPMHPGLLLCAAIGVLAGLRSVGWRRAATIALVVWWIGSVARSSPQWIGYFNEWAGGASNGDAWLLDSNIDWGQDDRRLASFLRQRAEPGSTWLVNPPADCPSTGRILVNVNELHGMLRMSDERYAWLRRHAADGRIGTSWKWWQLSVEDYATAFRQHPEDEECLTDYARILAVEEGASEALAVLRKHESRLATRGWQVAMEIALDAELQDSALEWHRRVPTGLRTDRRWQPLLQRLELQQQRLADPENPIWQLELGLYWAQMRDMQSAEPLLRSAAQALPSHLDSQRAWMVWLGQQGRYAEAAAVARQPAVSGTLRNERTMLEAAAITSQRLEEVLAEGGSIDADALRQLAQSEFEGDRADRAAAALVQLLRQNPADHDAMHLLGELQVRSKLRVIAERLTPRSLRSPTTETSTGETAP